MIQWLKKLWNWLWGNTEQEPKEYCCYKYCYYDYQAGSCRCDYCGNLCSEDCECMCIVCQDYIIFCGCCQECETWVEEECESNCPNFVSDVV